MDDPKKKNQETISIVVDDFNSAVPGVTMLLNPKVILEREASRMKLEQSGSAIPEAPLEAEASPQTPLAELGVILVLHFEEDGTGFKFLKAVPYSQKKIEDWQDEVYRGMRLELEVFGINISFQEFSAKKDPFEADAFCAPEDAWIQTVRSREHSSRMYVLITRRSLLMEKEKVYTLLEGSGEKDSGDESDDSGGIEIDFAS